MQATDGLRQGQATLVQPGDARVASGVFINARTDPFWLGRDDPISTVVPRAAAYCDAGADGIFVPGVSEPAVVAAPGTAGALAEDVRRGMPVTGAGIPPYAELHLS